MHAARDILKALEDCFDRDEIETLVARGDTQIQLGNEPVKVVHKPTGSEFIGEGHNQIKNKIAALLQLISAELPRISTEDPS